MPVRLFVGNLPYDATEEEIRTHFSTAGNVLNVFVPVDRETGRKRGFAFVEFQGSTEAQEAIRLFNSQPFKGRPLAVNEARARESRLPWLEAAVPIAQAHRGRRRGEECGRQWAKDRQWVGWEGPPKPRRSTCL